MLTSVEIKALDGTRGSERLVYSPDCDTCFSSFAQFVDYISGYHLSQRKYAEVVKNLVVANRTWIWDAGTSRFSDGCAVLRERNENIEITSEPFVQ